MDLLNKKCIPCEAGGKALKPEEISVFARGLLDWTIDDNVKIKREFKFTSFIEALSFVNDMAKIAEEEGHHPDIHIYYNKVVVELQTHAVSGLTENDFILATKIDRTHTSFLTR